MASITTLTCLRVEADHWLPSEETIVALVESNPNLEEISIIKPIGDAAFAKLVRRCPRLAKLHVDAAKLKGASLRCLMDCKSIRSLPLDNCSKSSAQQVGISLSGVRHLTHLVLRSAAIHEDELQTLLQGSGSCLESLDLLGFIGPSPFGLSGIGSRPWNRSI